MGRGGRDEPARGVAGLGGDGRGRGVAPGLQTTKREALEKMEGVRLCSCVKYVSCESSNRSFTTDVSF